MLEYSTSDASYSTFFNRVPRPDNAGMVRVRRVPTDDALRASRSIDLAVLIISIVLSIARVRSEAVYVAILALQLLHGVYKASTWWRPAMVADRRLSGARRARPWLQGEHTLYLTTLAMLLAKASDVPSMVAMALIVTAMVGLFVAMFASLPSRKQPVSHG